jgi:hypothetical protein
MSKLQWRVASASELATLLTEASLDKSAAVGGSTVYQVVHDEREKLVISTSDGLAIVIELADMPRVRRRRLDPILTENGST